LVEEAKGLQAQGRETPSVPPHQVPGGTLRSGQPLLAGRFGVRRRPLLARLPRVRQRSAVANMPRVRGSLRTLPNAHARRPVALGQRSQAQAGFSGSRMTANIRIDGRRAALARASPKHFYYKNDNQ
jgi:hypothetical protein